MSRGWLIGLVAAVVVATAGWILVRGPFDWTNERVQQAGVVGIFIALGWFTGFALRETSALIGRRERLRDAHRALYAEIQHNVENLRSEAALGAHAAETHQRIIEGDGYVPFIPRERNNTVFTALLPDLYILPRVTIDPVVQYYSQLAAQDALAEDMRGESFKAMAPQRRAFLFDDFMRIKVQALDYGKEALATIDSYSKAPRRAREVSRRHRVARRERIEALDASQGEATQSDRLT